MQLIFCFIIILACAYAQRENPMTHYAKKETGHDSSGGSSDYGSHNSEQQNPISNFRGGSGDSAPIPTNDDHIVNDHLADSISASIFEFGRSIGQILSESNYGSKSEVFSPLSAMSALSLVLLGARGKTYNQLSRLFGIDYNDNPHTSAISFHEEFAAMLRDVQKTNSSYMRNNAPWRGRSDSRYVEMLPEDHIINIANGFFTHTDYSLNPNYRDVVTSVYHSDLIRLNFQNANARNEVNKWVSDRTFGKIPNIIPDSQIPRNTKLLIASALYFKAIWENSFFEKATVLDDFYPNGPNQGSIKVKMMATGGAFPSYDSQEYDCRIIGLPYKGNVTSMYIVQPNNSTRQKLKEFQKELTSDKLDFLINRMTKKSTVLAMPKMTTVRSINLKSLLSSLGVDSLFKKEESDLSLISSEVKDDRPVFAGNFGGNLNSRRLPRHAKTNAQLLTNLENQRALNTNAGSDIFVHDILHKVNFEVNEFGTEAAAATLTYLRRSGPEVLFRAETPFIVLIRHDPTKLILFYGIINEPES